MIQPFFGIFVFIFISFILSENKRKISPRFVAAGLFSQFLLAAVLLKFPYSKEIFIHLNKIVLILDEATKAGTSFVFGYIGGGDLPFQEAFPGRSFSLAFQALPIVLVISAVSSLLFYWKILPLVVRGFSYVLTKTLKIGGAEGVGVSANIFIGMVESPLLIRPYLNQMTRSEIFSVMTTGMATIAGTVMVLYAGILSDKIPGILGHILTASIISVPAALITAKIMIPETKELTKGEFFDPEPSTSSMDAVTKGTVSGLNLWLNIIAMIIVLVALVHLVNIFLSMLPLASPLTLQKILGFLMAPVAWLMGIPWSEAFSAGSLLGTKTILNEFIAYLELLKLPQNSLSPSSELIITYALCGFANPGSLGIMIGGLGAMAPERRNEIVSLGLRSVIAGTIATCMTGAVASIFI
ncbi:MAG: NupC/NupG family nucleoside CNT transporter [Desulfobacteraceae bacterium]